jgi:hypothetical protein
MGRQNGAGCFLKACVGSLTSALKIRIVFYCAILLLANRGSRARNFGILNFYSWRQECACWR